MKDEKDKDALEQLFKKFLSEDQPALNGWNVPSDDILFNALDEVGQEKKKRPFWFFWIFSGLAFLLIATILIWATTRINEMNKTIEVLQQQQISQEQPILEANATKNLNELSSGPELSAKQESGIDANHQEEVQNNPQSYKPIEAISITHTTELKKEYKPLPITERDKEKEESPKASNLILPLSLLPAKSFGLNVPTKNTLQVKQALPPVEQEENKFQKSKALYFLMGPRFSALELNGKANDQILLEGFDNKRLGFGGGLGYKQNIGKKIFIDYRFSYSNFSNTSSYQNQVAFEEANTSQDASGRRNYQSEMEVFTPLGRSIFDAPLPMNEVELRNQELMQVNTKIKQEFQLLELSSGLGWQVFKLNKLELLVSGHLHLDYLLHFHEWAGIDFKKENDLVMFGEYNKNTKENINPWLFGFSGTSSLNYHLNDRFYIGAEATSFRTLNSLGRQNASRSAFLRDLRFNLVMGFNLN